MRADQYAQLFALVIKSWRQVWKDDLPFLFVQLTSFGKELSGNGKMFPALRAQQEKASKAIDGTYMASIMDVGELRTIHPPTKRPVGERLAAIAKAKVYGIAVPYASPFGESAHREGNEITVSFSGCDNGLVLRGNLVNGLQVYCRKREKKGFEVSLRGSTLVIRADFPIDEIRYEWKDYVDVNLYSAEGFPARPFVLKIG